MFLQKKKLKLEQDLDLGTKRICTCCFSVFLTKMQHKLWVNGYKNYKILSLNPRSKRIAFKT